MDPLRTSLLDLHYELRDEGMPLTVGGGLGLFLKRMHLIDRQTRTMFTELPEPRATNDIDLYLRVDVLASHARTEALVAAIRRLGYEPVEEAKYLQWKRPVTVGGTTQEVKLDILVGPLGEKRAQLQVNPPRVRPKGKSVGFHAYKTDEALFIEEQPVAVEVRGVLSGGAAYTASMFVPEAFPYLLMKLSAFADRKADARKDLGRHHALDAYAIIGMMTEAEYERTRELADRCKNDQHYRQVCAVVAEDFASPTSLGMLRMQEHPLFRGDFRVGEFITVLGEVFTQ